MVSVGCWLLVVRGWLLVLGSCQLLSVVMLTYYCSNTLYYKVLPKNYKVTLTI